MKIHPHTSSFAVVRAILLLTSLLLAGCSSTSGVVPIGNGEYMISCSKKGFVSGSMVKSQALKQANQYAAQRGKGIEIVSVTSKDMMPFKSDAYAEVVFRLRDRRPK
jgi:hypothetical protein